MTHGTGQGRHKDHGIYNDTTFYDRDRRLQGVFAAARDITERKTNSSMRSRNECRAGISQVKQLRKPTSPKRFLSSMVMSFATPSMRSRFAQLWSQALLCRRHPKKQSIAQILQAGWHPARVAQRNPDLAVVESG